MERAGIVLRPDCCDASVAGGGDGGRMVIAAAGEPVELAASRGHDLVGGVLVRQPHGPALALGRHRDGRVIIQLALFRQLLLKRQAFDRAVAGEHGPPLAERHTGRKFERAGGRVEAHASRWAALHAHHQPLGNHPANERIIPIRLPVGVFAQQLVFEVADPGLEFERAIGLRAVGLRETPAFDPGQLRAGDRQCAFPGFRFTVGKAHNDSELERRENARLRAHGSRAPVLVAKPGQKQQDRKAGEFAHNTTSQEFTADPASRDTTVFPP